MLETMLRTRISLLDLSLRCANPDHPLFLILAQPNLLRLAQNSLPQKVNQLAEHDEHKRDRIQEMDPISKHSHPDNHAPKVGRQQTDVEKRGRSQAIQNRHKRVEERQHERVPRQIPTHLRIPHRRPKRRPIENPRLHPIDNHRPPPQLPHNLIQRPLTNQKLLRHITQPVKGRTSQREQIALELVGRRDTGAVAGSAGQTVGAEQQAHAADADQDAADLVPGVADAEEQGG